MFDGAGNHDPELHPPLNRERLARMAEAGNWLHEPGPPRRSRHWLYVEAMAGVICIAALTLWALVGLP